MSTDNPYNSKLSQKWSGLLEGADFGAPIKDEYKKAVVAQVLENQYLHSPKNLKGFDSLLNEDTDVNGQIIQEGTPNMTGGTGIAQGNQGAATDDVAGFSTVLMNIVRRATPKLIPFDVCGIQPMTAPSQMLFAMKSRYSTKSGDEALFHEANSAFSGTGTQTGDMNDPSLITPGTAISTAEGELLGSGASGAGAFAEMAFSIEKTNVTAETRKLKSTFSLELAQDMKAVHGLNPEVILTDIMSREIVTEQNREVIRTLYMIARTGAQTGTAAAGHLDMDTDVNARWQGERFASLLYAIEREANAIGQLTRAGRGNVLITSADVASALALTGKLVYNDKVNTDLGVDDTSSTFAGVLLGKYKVYIDPYMSNISNSQYFVMGYKGASPFDAGMFFCPYIPLQLLKARDPDTFQPVLGFQTRYGLVANPFVSLDTGNADNNGLKWNSNYYYRRVLIDNLA